MNPKFIDAIWTMLGIFVGAGLVIILLAIISPVFGYYHARWVKFWEVK